MSANDNAAGDAAQTARIPVHSDTRDQLRARKVGNETYDDVVNRLLEVDA